MATLKFTMPEDFMKRIEHLERDVKDIVEDMLEAGGKVGVEAAKSALNEVVGRVPHSRSTGELKSSLGKTSVKKDRHGTYNIRIGFNEPRRKQAIGKRGKTREPVTNGLIANVLEYGKKGQRPRPFMVKARVSSAKHIESAMQAELDKAVK